MTSVQQLGIGTAQFGLDYGISNNIGQVALEQARAIINHAQNSGIYMLDTAVAYGDSETVVGSCIENLDKSRFCIYTKTIPLKTEKISPDDLEKLTRAFETSLKNLGLDHVTGLLVHHADDLLNSNGEQLFEYLHQLKSSGKIKKLGVSVYSKEQIDQLLKKYQFDFMQLPINVFDQRLLQNGTIAMLGKRGIEIHARSIFLQGVLLMQPDDLPEHLHALKAPLLNFQMQAKCSGLSPLAAALMFIKQISKISTAIIGVVTVEHLKECISAYANKSGMTFSEFAQTDNRLIDPRSWPTNT